MIKKSDHDHDHDHDHNLFLITHGRAESEQKGQENGTQEAKGEKRETNRSGLGRELTVEIRNITYLNMKGTRLLPPVTRSKTYQTKLGANERMTKEVEGVNTKKVADLKGGKDEKKEASNGREARIIKRREGGKVGVLV